MILKRTIYSSYEGWIFIPLGLSFFDPQFRRENKSSVCAIRKQVTKWPYKQVGISSWVIAYSSQRFNEFICTNAQLSCTKCLSSLSVFVNYFILQKRHLRIFEIFCNEGFCPDLCVHVQKMHVLVLRILLSFIRSFLSLFLSLPSRIFIVHPFLNSILSNLIWLIFFCQMDVVLEESRRNIHTQ